MSKSNTWTRALGSVVVDAFCLFSVVGIWPRFIEPKRLKKTYLDLILPSKHLDGLKIVHISDLHFHAKTSRDYLNKVIERVRKESPDLILFTGDFICYSRLQNKEILHDFLRQLQAPHGSFCIFGNHDYASYVSRTRSGDYAILKPVNPLLGFLRGFKSFFAENKLGKVTDEVLALKEHEELAEVVKESGFTLLENKTHCHPLGINLVGLGDYGLGKCCPDLAFEGVRKDFPTIVLTHNPDSLPLLQKYPGDLILAGHTHGEQIHFPYPAFMRKLSKKLTRLENSEYTRGLYSVGGKQLYVNRGLGCHKPIRLFSPPEILVLTIRGKGS